MLDIEAFEERAAIAEFDGGLSRFRAETLAAEAQGVTRWQAIEEINRAERERNSQRGGDHRAPLDGQPREDNVSRVQFGSAQEVGPVSQRDQNAGRDGLALLALRA